MKKIVNTKTVGGENDLVARIMAGGKMVYHGFADSSARVWGTANAKTLFSFKKADKSSQVLFDLFMIK